MRVTPRFDRVRMLGMPGGLRCCFSRGGLQGQGEEG